MQKTFGLLFCLILVFAMVGCENNQEQKTKTDKSKIATFDISYDEFVSTITKGGYDYKEVNSYNFENEESNAIGVIYINPNDELDIIRTQIRHSHDEVFQVVVSYTITDNSLIDTSEKTHETI